MTAPQDAFTIDCHGQAFFMLIRSLPCLRALWTSGVVDADDAIQTEPEFMADLRCSFHKDTPAANASSGVTRFRETKFLIALSHALSGIPGTRSR